MPIMLEMLNLTIFLTASSLWYHLSSQKHRVSEKPYKVWGCLNNLASCEILTGECGCIAGYSESCKHVFALLHYV